MIGDTAAASLGDCGRIEGLLKTIGGTKWNKQ